MKKRARRAGPGKTLPKLAETYKDFISESTLRRAVARGDLNVVKFAGLNIVTPGEERRFCSLLEIPPAKNA
jgi:hypothetical protein